MRGVPGTPTTAPRRPHLPASGLNRLLPTLVLAAALLTAPSATAAERCVDDGDCSGVLLCRQGRCVPVHCQRHEQCPAGRMCHTELCRIRQCYASQDCTVGRRCEDGMCLMPPPVAMHRSGGGAGDEALDLRVMAGPWFPLGLLVELDLPAGADRWLLFGLGTSLIEGGFSWRLGVRSEPVRGDRLSLDLWAAVMGYVADAADTADPDADLVPVSAAEVATGSGRFLFSARKKVAGVWWASGTGLTWRHGDAGQYLLRLEVGAALLYNDRYPAEADFAVLPTVGLVWGVIL